MDQGPIDVEHEAARSAKPQRTLNRHGATPPGHRP